MPKRRVIIHLLALVVGVGGATGRPTGADENKAANGVARLPDNWGEFVSFKDLTDEISESAARAGQSLKKPADFDKSLKQLSAEGHLTAVLAALAQEHPDAAAWKSIAVQIQEQGLALAKAAEAKGAKNFKSAQEAHKKIVDLVKKKGVADSAASSPDWAALGALGDVMKRVDPCYKYIRGKMSNEAVFKRESEPIRHNAAMLYIFGQISPVFRPSETDMPKLSGAMSSAAADLLGAVKAADFAKASDANTAINNACNECHKAKRFEKKGSDFDF